MGRRDNGDGHIWQDTERGYWRGAVVIHGTTRHVRAGSKREVARLIKTLKAEAAPTGYTVRKASVEWMEEHVSALRGNTVAQYRQMLDLHILPVIGDMMIEDVRPRDIQGVVNKMALSASTKRHAHKVMSGMFRWMALNRMVERSPVEGIRLPPVGRSTRKSLTSEEIVKLLDAMRDSRWRHSVQLILMTGLRRGELLALRWSDISDGCIHVCRSRAPDGTEGPPKSEAGNRSILIGKAVQGVLDAQRAMLKMERIASPYVFPSEHGKPMMPNTYHNVIQYFAE